MLLSDSRLISLALMMVTLSRERKSVFNIGMQGFGSSRQIESVFIGVHS
jgi:hypothetical protein